MATNAELIKRLQKLQATLLTSGLQQQNQPLYQVIRELIKAVGDSLSNVLEVAESGGGSSITGDQTFLTVADELATLPQSSQLIAGDNVSFDTGVFGQLRIDVADMAGSQWSVLTNGDPVSPELIFAGGDVIMLETP
jgi:hypothetical protein